MEDQEPKKVEPILDEQLSEKVTKLARKIKVGLVITGLVVVTLLASVVVIGVVNAQEQQPEQPVDENTVETQQENVM